MNKQNSVPDWNEDNHGDDKQATDDLNAAAAFDVDGLRSRADAFFNLFISLQNDNVLLKRQLGERAARIADLDESVRQMNSSLSGEIDKNRQLEQAMAMQAESMDGQVRAASAEHDRLQSLLAEGKLTLQGLEQELDNLGRQYREAVEHHASARAALEQQIQTAQAAVRDMENTVHASEQRTADSQAMLADLHTQVEGLERQLADSASRNAELQAALQDRTAELKLRQDALVELEAHAGNLENLNNALHETSVTEQGRSRKVIEQRDREIARLRDRLESAPVAGNEHDQQLGELQDVQARLADAQQQLGEMAALQQALADAEGEIDRLGSQNAEIAGLRQMIAQLQAELAGTQQQPAVDDLQAEVRALYAENDRLKSELAQRDRQVAQAALPAAAPCVDEVCIDVLPEAAPRQAQPACMGRSEFTAALAGVLQSGQPEAQMAAVVYLLVDDFMQIRQDAGVLGSENVIMEIHDLLESRRGDDELLARFGDCTFALLVHEQDEGAVRQRAESLRTNVADRIFETSSSAVVATVSIGIACIQADESVDKVITRADSACETARECGGNQVQVHRNVESTGEILQESAGEAEFVEGVLRENRLQICFQPISALKSEASGYYEVLVRVLDEDGSNVNLAGFFDAVRLAGLCFDVDMRIIESAISLLASDRENSTTLFVKLFPETIASEDLVVRVMKLLKTYHIAPDRVVLEVTENTLKNDLKNVSSLTFALHAIGCKVAIEHYTLSTQAHLLKHIHADFIKIDASLTQRLGEDEDAAIRVRSIVDVAHSIGCRTVAENIESPYSLTHLFSLGVDYAQGYFIQEPGALHGYDFGGFDNATGRGDCDGKAVFDIN